MLPCPIGDGAPADVLPAVNIEIIKSLDYFIVENTRSARRFISSLKTGKTIDSLRFAECNEHTPPQEIAALVEPLLAGESAGFISEAGVPGVADPGAEVAALCHAKGIKVVPLVVPSSILLAMMASGQNGQSFAFNGYLPVKPQERAKAIRHFERRAAAEGQSQIFIEAPYRNAGLFAQLLEVCAPDTLLTVAADITAPTEFILSAPIRKWRTMPAPDINKRPAIFIIS